MCNISLYLELSIAAHISNEKKYQTEWVVATLVFNYKFLNRTKILKYFNLQAHPTNLVNFKLVNHAQTVASSRQFKAAKFNRKFKARISRLGKSTIEASIFMERFWQFKKE